MPTRNFQNVLKNRGIEIISPWYVSSLSARLNEKVQASMECRVDHEILYVYVDAMYFRARDGAAYRSKAL